MKRFLCISLMSILISGCGNKEEVKEPIEEVKKVKSIEEVEAEKEAAEEAAEEAEYLKDLQKFDKSEIKKKLNKDKIVFSELEVDNYYDKVILRVILKEKMNEKELKKFSRKLKYKYLYGYRSIYIFYDLNKSDDIAWAHCHFRPNMEFKILGSTIEDDLKLNEVSNNQSIDGNIIGKWKSNKSLMGAIITLVKRGDKIHHIINFKDGGKIDEKVSIKTVKGKKQYITNAFGEYYIIEKNGNLGMYGDNGKFDEAIKIE